MMFVTAAFWLTLMLVGFIGVLGGFLNLLLRTEDWGEAIFYALTIFIGLALFLWASDHGADALVVVLLAARSA